MLTRLPMAARGWRRPAAARHPSARIASYKTARLLRRTDNTRCRHLPGPDTMREVSIGPLAVHNGRVRRVAGKQDRQRKLARERYERRQAPEAERHRQARPTAQWASRALVPPVLSRVFPSP